jgi:hypothetical protein
VHIWKGGFGGLSAPPETLKNNVNMKFIKLQSV